MARRRRAGMAFLGVAAGLLTSGVGSVVLANEHGSPGSSPAIGCTTDARTPHSVGAVRGTTFEGTLRDIERLPTSYSAEHTYPIHHFDVHKLYAGDREDAAAIVSPMCHQVANLQAGSRYLFSTSDPDDADAAEYVAWLLPGDGSAEFISNYDRNSRNFYRPIFLEPDTKEEVLDLLVPGWDDGGGPDTSMITDGGTTDGTSPLLPFVVAALAAIGAFERRRRANRLLRTG